MLTRFAICATPRTYSLRHHRQGNGSKRSARRGGFWTLGLIVPVAIFDEWLAAGQELYRPAHLHAFTWMTATRPWQGADAYPSGGKAGRVLRQWASDVRS